MVDIINQIDIRSGKREWRLKWRSRGQNDGRVRDRATDKLYFYYVKLSIITSKLIDFKINLLSFLSVLYKDHIIFTICCKFQGANPVFMTKQILNLYKL